MAFLVLCAVAIAKEVKLPSGRVINIMQIGPMVFTSNLPTAWVLQYETKHPFSAKKEVMAEVEDIWTTFRLEVETRKMKMGIIKVVSPANGLILQQRTEINFVFEPTSDGGWKMQIPDLMKEEKKEPNQALQTTPPAVTSCAFAQAAPSGYVSDL